MTDFYDVKNKIKYALERKIELNYVVILLRINLKI